MESMIQFDADTRTFHLHNKQISYILRVMPRIQQLENLYFGPPIHRRADYDVLAERANRPAANWFEGSYTTSLEHIRQEYPTHGTTDYRSGAFTLHFPEGDTQAEFAYQGYEIKSGFPDLGELPHARYQDQEAQTLNVHLKETYSHILLTLSYTIIEGFGMVLRSAKFENPTDETYHLTKAMSACLDLPSDDFDMLSLHGAWARETQIQRQPLFVGLQQIGSTRGASSHMHNPFLALTSKNATEDTGAIYSTTLLYSGNFTASAEVDNYHTTRMEIGIAPEQFDWALAPNTSFQTPQAILTYNNGGLGTMSRAYHRFFRTHLIDQTWADQPKPILINNWEATFFNFNEDKLLALAKTAKTIGIDLFVLDDGWFGRRDSDNSSLGNWTVDQGKLPHGLDHFAKALHKMGMQFGLWFEPEMISKDTPLYHAHPDWVIGVPGKRVSHGRNQFVLDFSNPDVVTAIYQQIKAILTQTQIDYMKWDMNRYITEAFSTHLPASQQGELYHRYILGVYHLYNLIEQAFPTLRIESCAGGGGRFDAGMLYYAAQGWISDDTDAYEREKIQYGASLLYPVQSLTNHVSKVPNNQVGRNTPLSTRANVAMFGDFGYELDLNALPSSELRLMKRQIAFVKKHQHLIFTGDFYRLQDPFTENGAAWMVVSPDRKRALVASFKTLGRPNRPFARLHLAGLNPDWDYQVMPLDNIDYQPLARQVSGGDELSSMGIIMDQDYTARKQQSWQVGSPHDFSSQLFYLKARV